MESALDDVAFLANSENRVAVLEMIVEEPRDRDELRDQVDASRVTVARSLRELEERHWIVSTISSLRKNSFPGVAPGTTSLTPCSD